MTMEGLSAADIAAVTDKNYGYGDGFGFGGSWIWIIVLFALFGWGNGFGNRGVEALTRTDLFDGFQFQNVERGLEGIKNGLCDGFYAQNTTMLQGFNGVQRDLCQGFGATNAAIAENRYAAQQCCCETNRNIDAVRYENAKNTCDIINAGNANTQKILDFLTQDKIEALRTELQSAQIALQNTAQTQTIINTLQPVAKPAYVVCSPYQSANYYNNFGCGCGCGI